MSGTERASGDVWVSPTLRIGRRVGETHAFLMERSDP